MQVHVAPTWVSRPGCQVNSPGFVVAMYAPSSVLESIWSSMCTVT